MENRLKSLFIAILPFWGLLISFIACYQLLALGFTLSWAGVFISAFPIAVFFAKVFTIKSPRTSPNLFSQTLIIASGFLISLIGGFAEDLVYRTAIILAEISFIGWLVYVYWYSRYRNRDQNELIKVGKQLPDFSVSNVKGEQTGPSSFAGAPALYMFYRGNWCPLCMAQIKEISQKYQELAQRGVKIALISSQSHQHTESLAKRFEVPFHYWLDKDNQVAKQLKIYAKNGTPTGLQALGFPTDTVMPTVIITNAQNEIIFADLTDNYRVRPEPDTFLAVLEDR